MVFMPPGSAKSTYTTQLLPPYLFSRYPRCQIIGASHTADLAEDFSSKIQGVVRDNKQILGYGLSTENKSRWYTTEGGAYLAAGVGGAIPGFRADFVIIDDPIKGRQSADSEADRKRVWDWFIGDLERRLTPDSPIILMHTRWHEDDLAGRLLASEGDRWRVVSLPAEAEDDDPLGRDPGEWLWDDDAYGYAATLRDIRDTLIARGASREWAAQYQQRPRPMEGALFRIERITILPAVPEGGKSVRAYDLAATKKSGTRDPDWTRGVKLTMLPSKRLVIENVVSARGTPDDIERLMFNTATQDGKGVVISLPQDPGQAGKAQVAYLTKVLHGYHVVSSPESGDKATRAGPVISQVNVSNVDMVEGPWNRAFLDELAAFPAGVHDDQVDALSRAYSTILDRGRPLILSPQVLNHIQQVSTRNRFTSAGVPVRNRFARAM